MLNVATSVAGRGGGKSPLTESPGPNWYDAALQFDCKPSAIPSTVTNDHLQPSGPLIIRAGGLGSALAYEGKGDYRQAISLIPRPPNLSADDSVIPYATAALAHIYATAGMKKAALQQLAKLTEMSKQRFVQSYFFAVAYAGLGDSDQAFKSLDKGYDERPSDMINIKVDPQLDALRFDQRYHQLLLRMGLPD